MVKENNILLGITGSVATTVVPNLIKGLEEGDCNLKIVATASSLYFLPPEGLSSKVYTDEHEWANKTYKKGDVVEHIDFRNKADMLLIAPLTANTLAKIANGICDNFLCCIVRAWSKEKPLIIAPAMNTEMWIDPITQEHIKALEKRFNLTVVDPIEKVLACGDKGIGAMAETKDIVDVVMGL